MSSKEKKDRQVGGREKLKGRAVGENRKQTRRCIKREA